MAKFLLIIALISASVFGAEPLVDLIVQMGSTMKGHFVDDVLYFEEIHADENKAISSFIIKAKNPKDKEQSGFVKEMKKNSPFREEVLEEFARQNRDKLCENIFLERLQAINLTYVYEFRFTPKDTPIRKTINASDCPKALPQNIESTEIPQKVEWNETKEIQLKGFIAKDKVMQERDKQKMLLDLPVLSNQEKEIILEIYEMGEKLSNVK